MSLRFTAVFSFLLTAVSLSLVSQAQEQKQNPEAPAATAEKQPQGDLSVEEIRALLNSIDPYLPEANVSGEIDIFGSTSMDALAHGWLLGFKKFHPNVKVVVSAEGSETVFDRLAKSPGSIGMLSRPVTAKDLEELKSAGLKEPVAILVARDAMGVFVHESNPLTEITYGQLASLFCGKDPDSEVKWGAVGVEGELTDKPVNLVGRTKDSGTRTFIERYLFHSGPMRLDHRDFESNSDVLAAIAKNPQAIGIVDLKTRNPSVKRLNLRDKSTVFDGDDHDVLLGQYPIIRPLTLVFDLGQESEGVSANQELARYALTQAGQAQAILSGFFPFDPPTLRGERAKLEIDTQKRLAEKKSAESEPQKK